MNQALRFKRTDPTLVPCYCKLWTICHAWPYNIHVSVDQDEMTSLTVSSPLSCKARHASSQSNWTHLLAGKSWMWWASRLWSPTYVIICSHNLL